MKPMTLEDIGFAALITGALVIIAVLVVAIIYRTVEIPNGQEECVKSCKDSGSSMFRYEPRDKSCTCYPGTP